MAEAAARLRIGLATPFNVKSAIASYSREVGHELARRGHRVEILRTETGEALDIPAPESNLEVRRAGDVARPGTDYDLCLVNIGNYVRYHGAAPPLLESAPSVVVMHDADLSDLAWTCVPMATRCSIPACPPSARPRRRGTTAG